MHAGLISTQDETRKAARDLITKSKDKGAKWARGGWKDDARADEIGEDLGKEPPAGDSSFPDEWVRSGREGIERVQAGLSVF